MYTFSIFSGAIYSPWDNLKMCFFLSMMRSVPFWVDNKSRFTATPTQGKKRCFLHFFPRYKNQIYLLKATAPRPLNAASRHYPKLWRFFLGPSGSLWTHWGLAYRSDGTNNESAEPQLSKTHHRLGVAHFSLSVLGVVLHIRDVYQLHHGAWERSPDVSWKKKNTSASWFGTRLDGTVRECDPV